MAGDDSRGRSPAPASLQAVSCPAPLGRYDRVVLGHGSGGRLGHDLLEQVFLPALGGARADRAPLEDQAVVAGAGRIAVTTDSFVVDPIFFPGGDIGSLAIHGTVNDLAVGGAIPRYIAAAFILEEGMETADLARVLASMQAACAAAGVAVVTGDTKVVERGKGDRVYITTTGVGVVPDGVALSIAAARPGDQILVSGSLGDHGVAIMAIRAGLEFETPVHSDSAPLTSLARAVLDACPATRCMRDPTRGGAATALCELAAGSRVGVELDESALVVRPEVAGACELLGLDPLYVANEGKLIAVVPSDQTDQVLARMRAHPLGRRSAIIGRVVAEHPGLVTMRSLIGGTRVVPMLSGEQLPRIC